MSWRVEFIGLIIVSTLTDYYCGLNIHNFRLEKTKKLLFLLFSLSINLSLLFLFKYYNFFIDNLNFLFPKNSYDYVDFILPVGISFYTFQTLGYTIDVYRGTLKPETNIIKFATYVSYFPQLVAGPIERAKSFLPQLSNSKNLHLGNLKNGLRIVVWGFFKKMVVADNLAKIINHIFSITNASSLEILIATYFFAFQIYLDFSGYTDIAIGTSRMLGIKLRRNFRTPYFSMSIKEFWSRWHISLSTWFRDYLFIPMGGSRKSDFRMYLNLIITFVISGLWHGANWTFFIWGLYNGVLLCLEKTMNFQIFHSNNKIFSFIKYFTVFNLICIGWIFFRAEDIYHATSYLTTLFSLSKTLNNINSSHLVEMVIGIFGILIVLVLDYAFEKDKWKLRRYFNIQLSLRVLLISFGIITTLIFSAIDSSEFIYFQF